MTALAAWADLETPLDEGPVFYVEPTDKSPATETERVVAFRQLFRLAYPRCILIAVPNGAKRSQWALNQALREGMHLGAPDLFVFAPGGKCAALEFKAGKGKPTSRQVDCLNALYRMGFAVAVVRTPEGATRFLRERGFGDG
jgi:hypothetical protein